MFPGNSKRGLVIASLFVALSSVACDQQMANQPSYEPLEASKFFADGQSSRPLVEGTIPRGGLREDLHLYTGKMNGTLVNSLPMQLDDKVMKRGQERFNIYCSMCHGKSGYGDGMVVRRGYKRPTSFHTDRLRTERLGHFFDVITNGYGSMPAYGSMIPAEDRWAIVAYVRALQMSQNSGGTAATSAGAPVTVPPVPVPSAGETGILPGNPADETVTAAAEQPRSEGVNR